MHCADGCGPVASYRLDWGSPTGKPRVGPPPRAERYGSEMAEKRDALSERRVHRLHSTPTFS